jgi:hypothetical protein
MVLDARLQKLSTGVSAKTAAHAFVRSMSPREPLSLVEQSQASEFAATVEAMFLMAAVDGAVSPDELWQLRSSVEAISSPEPVAAGLDALLSTAADKLSAEGWQSRLDQVAHHLTTSESRLLAFRLAAAVAMVDDDVAHAEAAAIDALSSAFGISPDDSQAALREVVRELFGDG